MAIDRQSSALPPAQPSYILRGHTSQIHSVQFVRQNSHLLTGDADGWIVFWKVETKRALAVWKAHDGAILGTEQWGNDKFITHGRDNSLRIWQLRAADESTLSTILPVEDSTAHRPKPWLLHTLPVNTLNFCAFSMCKGLPRRSQIDGDGHGLSSTRIMNETILVGVPARDDKKIEIYQFPDERLKCVVPRVQSTDTGMVMAVKLVQHTSSKGILIIAGYEGGHTAIHQMPSNGGSSILSAELIYLSHAHTQPVLSLDISLETNTYYTSSADANIAAHRIPDISLVDAGTQRTTTTEVKAKREESTDSHSDGTVSSKQTSDPVTGDTQNAAASVLNASSASPQQIDPSGTALDPLTFPKKSALSTAPDSSLSFTKTVIQEKTPAPKLAGLSNLLFSTASKVNTKSPPIPKPVVTLQPPFKTINTKHAGQQSLRVRSDGRILVTGGWDSRIRIYSTKKLKEVAVLKWHKEGVYAVDFATVLSAEDLLERDDDEGGHGNEVARRETGLGKLQRQREEQMQLKRWVVAGAKDGKVSLWEVF